jgi:hypothetical protein
VNQPADEGTVGQAECGGLEHQQCGVEGLQTQREFDGLGSTEPLEVA